MRQVFVCGMPRETLYSGMLLDLSSGNKGEEKRFLYYELTVANPVKGQPSISVSAMISSSHDTPQIHYRLGKFRLNNKKIFGHYNTSVPSVIISDRSLVFLISALLNSTRKQCHLQKNSEGCLPNDPVQRKTNATAEQRFRVLKDVSLSGQKINRIDVFSQELKHHTEAIQRLGSLNSITKKTRQPLKKASVLIEEKWKKTPMKRAISGKYQSKPKKVIKTGPLISNLPSNTAITYPDTKTNETENLNTRPKVQEQNEMTDLGKPPSYHSEDTIRNRALRLYNEDSRYLVTAFNLDNSPYLNEIYTQMSLQSCKPYMIQSFKEQHSQLKNTENNCWFNSVVQLLKNSYLMMDVNENFINDLSYREGQRHILKVFHNAAIGNEITSNQLENALREFDIWHATWEAKRRT
ncbi:unnamed protein product [Mytilus edulis]|uniref:Uncharacterized protein n=1 Tax=Mytilus edulis TaxID=6550 RepID=A0A8S3SEP1_MYTED|nr:unnamed protein product [Mytilus edulis]